MDPKPARSFPYIPVAIGGILVVIVGVIFLLFQKQGNTPHKTPGRITVTGFPIAQKVESTTQFQRDYSHIYSAILSYKQKTNAFPSSLADLVPTYIPKSQENILHDSGLSYNLLTNGNDFSFCTTELIKGQKYCQNAAAGQAK